MMSCEAKEWRSTCQPICRKPARRHARQSANELGLQRAQIAGVQDIRPEFAQALVEAAVPGQIMAGTLAQIMKFDAGIGDALGKRAMTGQTDDRVTITVLRQAVDQIDHAVFHAACTEVVDDMRNQHLLAGASAYLHKFASAPRAALRVVRKARTTAIAPLWRG